MKNNKTISVKLYFFTNKLPEKIDGRVACWAIGNLQVEANSSKGIKNTQKSLMFHSVEEIPQLLKKAFKKEKIILVG